MGFIEQLQPEWRFVRDGKKTFEEVFDFYQKQIDDNYAKMSSANDKAGLAYLSSYARFIKFLYTGIEEYPGPYFNPLTFKCQLTYPQYVRILIKKRYTYPQVEDVILSMVNDAKPTYFNKKKHFGLCLESWLQNSKKWGGSHIEDTVSVAKTPKRVAQ